jgi:hypothetical protein
MRLYYNLPNLAYSISKTKSNEITLNIFLTHYPFSYHVTDKLQKKHKMIGATGFTEK